MFSSSFNTDGCDVDIYGIMMLGACRQTVWSGNSMLMPYRYISACTCRSSLTKHVLHRSTELNADWHGYTGGLKTIKRFHSRYIQGFVSQTLKSTPPWRTVFFGTDEYALVHLKALNENR